MIRYPLAQTDSILPNYGTSTESTPTFPGYANSSPVMWDTDCTPESGEFGFLKSRPNRHSHGLFQLPSPSDDDDNAFDAKMMSPISVDVPTMRLPARGRTETKKKLGGVQRSQTTGSKARKVVNGVNRPSRREGRLAVIDDELQSWDSKEFVNPRPAPMPPPKEHPSVFHPPRPSKKSGDYPSALDESHRRCRHGSSTSVVPKCKVLDSPPVFQQPTPIEPPHNLCMASPIYSMPKQLLGGDMMSLPTICATCPPVVEVQTIDSSWSIDSPSVDSSMDRVYVQIQDCLAATDRMDEKMLSCSFIDYEPIASMCSLLKKALREMQQNIDQGLSCVELNSPEKLAWSAQREALEASVQKNVRKYYELATLTAEKPPRVNHLDSRMEKLAAYLRKFNDLNGRILACYEKLRLLELRSQLARATAEARRRKAEEAAQQRERTQRWKAEKHVMESLRQDIQALREARSSRLADLKYAALSPTENVI